MPVLNFIGGPAYGLSKTGSTISIVEGGASSLNLACQIWNAVLLPASWDTINKTYTLSVPYVTSTSNQFIFPQSTVTQGQYEALAAAEIVGTSQATGQLVLKALGEIPSIEAPISIMVLPF